MSNMTEPTIHCPHCQTAIQLTKSLIAPFLAANQATMNAELNMKMQNLEREKIQIQSKQRELSVAKDQFQVKVAEQVAVKVQAQTADIAAQEHAKAQTAVAQQLASNNAMMHDLQTRFVDNEEKLKAAQIAQVQAMKKTREIETRERELNIIIEQRVQLETSQVRQQAEKEANEQAKFKLAEKDMTIEAMKKTTAEMQQKLEQGSQQTQGEVQELELENMLRLAFPFDHIEPVAKGIAGADAMQKVRNTIGALAGSILWESKRTKNWSDAWLPKLREDQRNAKADVCIIVTQVLPKDVESFACVDGVWVTTPRFALAVASVLRSGVLQVSQARASSQGQHTKTEMVYEYLTGVSFRQRVEAIMEIFSSMHADLEKERKAITKQWAKREEQIKCIMGNTAGMYGDLQGIVGTALPELAAFDMAALGN